MTEVFCSETRKIIENEIVDSLSQSASPHLKISVNENSSTSDVSIVFFNSDIGEKGKAKHNCVWIEPEKLISCDHAVIDILIKEFQLTEYYEINQARKYLLKWILAHELGHYFHQHDSGHFVEETSGFAVFDAKSQQRELDADAYSVCLMGDASEERSFADYGFLIDFVNIIVRKSLCPNTFPETCEKIPPGVGILYDYTSENLIEISVKGTHPDLVARFLRMLYLSASMDSSHYIRELAGDAIQTLKVRSGNGSWERLNKIFNEESVDLSKCQNTQYDDG